MEQIGRLLGVLFSAGEVRGWAKQSEGPIMGMSDEDTLLVPLSFMIRPESREGIQKMVGQQGLSLPEGYKRKDGEVVVDLGQVTPEEFKQFVESHRVDSLKG